MGHVDEYDEAVGRYTRQLGLTSVQLHNPSNLAAVDGYWSSAAALGLSQSGSCATAQQSWRVM